MKTLLGILLLTIGLMLVIFAQNDAKNEVDKPPVNVIVIVLTNTNQLSMVLQIITNQIPSAVIYRINPKIMELETRIRLEERHIEEKWGNLPKTYVSNTSTHSAQAITNLMQAWAEKDIAVSNLNQKKLELGKMKLQ